VHNEDGEDPSFEYIDRVVVKEIPFFQGSCMQYYFEDFPAGG